MAVGPASAASTSSALVARSKPERSLRSTVPKHRFRHRIRGGLFSMRDWAENMDFGRSWPSVFGRERWSHGMFWMDPQRAPHRRSPRDPVGRRQRIEHGGGDQPGEQQFDRAGEILLRAPAGAAAERAPDRVGRRQRLLDLVPVSGDLGHSARNHADEPSSEPSSGYRGAVHGHSLPRHQQQRGEQQHCGALLRIQARRHTTPWPAEIMFAAAGWGQRLCI